jgi:hypothetical protein
LRMKRTSLLYRMQKLGINRVPSTHDGSPKRPS